MKYSIIEDIFYGRRGQNENMTIDNDTIKLNEECIKFYYGLKKSLDESQKEQLENLLNAELNVEAETALNYFKEGLKIGLLLISECLL